MRMRRKPNLIPRMERCARVLISDPEARRGNWRELMPEAETVYLELGCGTGRFTAAMERVCAKELHNVFFVDGDAALLPQYFAPGEVSRIYINFCDPWPGNRHAKRRLTHPDFLLRYRQVLSEDGEIHFKTDNRDLFEWSLFQFPRAGFTLSQVTRDLHADGVCGVMTDYEEKFHSLGTPINRCVATVGPLPEPEEPSETPDNL